MARQTFEDDSSIPNVPNMNKAGYSRLANLLDMESVALEPGNRLAHWSTASRICEDGDWLDAAWLELEDGLSWLFQVGGDVRG
jgi:hypothetical protein